MYMKSMYVCKKKVNCTFWENKSIIELMKKK